MATSIATISAWQTVYIATLYRFSKTASEQIIMELNASGVNTSHASYDTKGLKFKVECLIADAPKAYVSLSRIINQFVNDDQERADGDPKYQAQASRLFESHLDDLTEPNNHCSIPHDNFSESSNNENLTDSQEARPVNEVFIPKEREKQRTPLIRHLSVGSEKVDVKLVRLANLHEPLLGRILLTPRSPHIEDLGKSNVVLPQIYDYLLQKYKSLQRVQPELLSGMEVDIFRDIHFSTNFRANKDGPIDATASARSSSKTTEPNVGEWLSGVAAAEEDEKSQSQNAPDKIRALFGDADKGKIPPSVVQSVVPEPSFPSTAVSIAKPSRRSTRLISHSSSNNTNSSVVLGSMAPVRITKYSETPAPTEAWDKAEDNYQTTPIVCGRWGEEFVNQEPGAELAAIKNHIIARQARGKTDSYSQTLESVAQPVPDLIDLSVITEHENLAAAPPPPPPPPPGFSEIMLPEIRTQNLRTLEQRIVEKVEEDDEDIMPRAFRRTMRQKAGLKNRKNKSTKVAAAHAQLKADASELIQNLSSSSSATHSEGPTRAGSSHDIPQHLSARAALKNLSNSQSTFVRSIQDGLNSVKTFSGSLTFEVQLGQVILLEKNVDNCINKNPIPMSNLMTQLSTAQGFDTACDAFTTAATANMGDLTGFLEKIGIDPADPTVKPYAIYELVCQRADNQLVHIHVDASDPLVKPWVIPQDPEILVAVYMHFPKALHDARALIRYEPRIYQSEELEEFVHRLRITMSEHDPSLPSIYGEDYGDLRIKAAYIRSAAKYKIPGKPCLLQIMRVHDLECSRSQVEDDSVGNFNADPSDKATMVERFRMWYELSIELSNPLTGLGECGNNIPQNHEIWDAEGSMRDSFLKSLIELQNVTSSMVYLMDGIGSANKGLAYKKWIKIDEEKKKKGDVESFW